MHSTWRVFFFTATLLTGVAATDLSVVYGATVITYPLSGDVEHPAPMCPSGTTNVAAASIRVDITLDYSAGMDVQLLNQKVSKIGNTWFVDNDQDGVADDIMANNPGTWYVEVKVSGVKVDSESGNIVNPP